MQTLSDLRPHHPHAVAALEAALSAQRLPHAHLFAGRDPSALVALCAAFSATLVCRTNGSDACGQCPGCRKMASGNHPDRIVIAPAEGKTAIQVEQIRTATQRLRLSSSESSTRVILIPHADAMTSQAQNALLKSLEEPPMGRCFILWTTRPKSLLPTIRSRCQRLQLAPQPSAEAWRALAQDGAIPTPVARALAPLVGADVASAQTLLDRDAEEILAAVRRALAPSADAATIIDIAADLGRDRERADLALSLLEVEIRDRMAIAFGAPAPMLYSVDDAAPAHLDRHGLSAAAAKLTEVRKQQAFNSNRTMALETLFLCLTGRSAQPSHRHQAVAGRG